MPVLFRIINSINKPSGYFQAELLYSLTVQLEVTIVQCT